MLACGRGGGMVGGMGGLERCPRESPRPEPEIARSARVPTGEVGAESKLAGAAGEPCPAGAEAARRVVAAEVLVVDPGSDIVIRLGRGLVGVRWARAIRKGEVSAVQGSRRGNQCHAVA